MSSGGNVLGGGGNVYTNSTFLTWYITPREPFPADYAARVADLEVVFLAGLGSVS